MICIETQHFHLNRILLLAIGLWPYQISKFVRLQIILFSGILTSFVIFQLTALITTECTPEFIIKVFSTAMFFSIYVIKYNSFWVNAHNVKYLLEQLQDICNQLKDKNEIAIIEKYGNNAKYFTTISIVMCGAFIAILLPIWPHILDTDLHINESQPRQRVQIVTEYFVNQEKYFYLILLHKNAVICIGATTLTGTGTMLVGYIICACGMFKIASYRIEQAMTSQVLKNINLENQTMIYKEIIDAVDIHRKAIKFCEFLSSTFQGSFFLLIIIGVISLSLNIYGIFQNISLDNKEAFLLHLLFVSVILLYMFVANYAGQEITNHNNHVYSITYNSRWYNAPLQAQKLILFILLNGSRTYNLNIGGVIVASLECFATLTKASMSYFTVMYSMQQ
ncbi:odorant receptor 49b-like [Formica exsecta]|uniref:odorant receptor 49b-like n=1 Tax=Formica exsecta TaxID=72781 RepID=UPI001141652F|nr:odorant receptor 49b-like [Formica exsecta]